MARTQSSFMHSASIAPSATLQTAPSGASASVPAIAAPGWPALLEHRSFLVRFAERRLLDPSLAEDLVHDVFEAVVTGRARFEGRSALRSWLVAVLKHKLVDLIRERAPQLSLESMAEGDDEGQEGFDLECPQPGPEQRVCARQRLGQTLARMAALPDTLRRAVELRLLHDRPTAEVCDALQISEENLFVRLHRARRQLAMAG